MSGYHPKFSHYPYSEHGNRATPFKEEKVLVNAPKPMPKSGKAELNFAKPYKQTTVGKANIFAANDSVLAMPSINRPYQTVVGAYDTGITNNFKTHVYQNQKAWAGDPFYWGREHRVYQGSEATPGQITAQLSLDETPGNGNHSSKVDRFFS